MGRWAHCLFGHDAAIGHAIKVIREIAQGDDRLFAHMMDKVLVASPLGVVGYYAQEYSLIDKLQGDVDESMDGSRDFDNSKYLQVVLAAVVMEYGATIKEAHMKHLRDIVPKIQCNENTVIPLIDNGFRGPGKRQFLAALDHYQAGKPRSFQEPSCHCCGKINGDIEAEWKTLMKCSGCKNQIAAGWFCDKDCQRALWKRHKPNCGAPLRRGMAIFKSYGKTTCGIMAYEGANV